MHLCVLVIHDEGYKQDILTGLQSIGVVNAVAVEGQDLEAQLGSEMSLFRGFFASHQDNSRRDLLFFSCAETQQLEQLIKNLTLAGLPVHSGRLFSLWSVPTSFAFDSKN